MNQRLEPGTPAPHATGVDVCVSFDIEHDAELYELLLEQSQLPGSGYTIRSCSGVYTGSEAWHDRARRRIQNADQLIVICGIHTAESVGVFSELRLAQELATPYFLLWGRRESMCAKPEGAKRTDGMFRWTAEAVQDQVSLTARAAARAVRATAMKRKRGERNSRPDHSRPQASASTGERSPE